MYIQLQDSIYIDGSNPEFIRTLRQLLGVNTDPYPGHKNCTRIEAQPVRSGYSYSFWINGRNDDVSFTAYRI
jgi:hypothetical protein